MAPEERPPAPPRPSPDITAGSIYVKWRDRLWQEQPDGTFLVWNDQERVWETSEVQPPSERRGQAITTVECPSCGKRVRTGMRRCPHCNADLSGMVAVKPKAQEAARGETRTVRISAPVRARVIAIALVLGLAVSGGILYLQQRSEKCADWNASVETVTDITIQTEGLPEDKTTQELLDEMEQRYASQKPGGC